jgi:hypothetical protein
VASGHFVAGPDLALLRYADAHELVDARRQFVARVTREDFDLYDFAALTVWDTQRGIFNFTRFLTKDGAQQFLLGGQFGFALGRNLADQDILGTNFGPDVDDAALVKVAQSLFTNVGNVAGDFFRTELGIACVDFVFLYMNGREEVFTHNAFADENGVFVVATLPTHEGDQDVLTEREFA